MSMQIINWDDYFMSFAYISSLRSKDPRTQVGACIVDKNHRIISTGYNGMVNGCNDINMPWGRSKGLDGKYLYVVHAELNAILHSKINLEGCKIYVTLFPCNECAKAIIQSGIKEIIYLNDKYRKEDQIISAKFMLDMVNINYRQLISDTNINIDFKKEE